MDIKKLLRNSISNCWNLAFIEGGFDTVISKEGKIKLNWLKHNYKDRWFADPFLLSVDEELIIVLVEEFRYDHPIGRIAKLVIDRQTYKLLEMVILLDLPTHLSFPFIYRKGADVFIIPENSKSGASYIYKFNNQTNNLKRLSTVIDLPLTDATVYRYCDTDYLLSTNLPTPNGNEMIVYEWDMEKLEANIDKSHVIKYSSNYARNAGAVFNYNGLVIRPAQDCNTVYGGGVIFHTFSCDNNDDSDFDILTTLYPNSFRYNQGLHTYNQLENLAVIDGRGYRMPFLGRIVHAVFSLYCSLRHIDVHH